VAVVAAPEWPGTSHPEGNASAMWLGFCGTNGISILTERQTVVAGVLQSDPADNVAFHVIVP
jgi:hypothetical protein